MPEEATGARRRRATAIVAVALSAALLGALGAGAWLLLQLRDAKELIDEQKVEIREQRELIDKKEVFGAGMNRLHDSIETLAGLPFASVVPWTEYDALASRAWAKRWDAAALDKQIAAAAAATARLVEFQSAAQVEASSNASGSAWESTLDQLGRGWVTTSIDDVSVHCDGDPLACVVSDDPFVVHVDAGSETDESMTDWIRTGVAYHEFAHVLQNTNPGPTEDALAAFGGDWETMADCYALAALDGWSLDHVVWVNAYEYWEVSVGYGYTCDESQRQVIRDWVSKIGVVARPIGG